MSSIKMSNIKVGRRVGNSYPEVSGYINVLCLTPSTPYGCIGPYVLENQYGNIMENIWQFGKVYKNVPQSRQTYSRYNNTVIWDHQAQTHVDSEGYLTKDWFEWCLKGLRCGYAVRYPVGMNHRHACIGCVPMDILQLLMKMSSTDEEKKIEYPRVHIKQLIGYIDARKQIYVPVYTELVIQHEKFKKLVRMLKDGKKLLILEVDGPHLESLQYYKDKYGVKDGFIIDNTIDATDENLAIMLEDERHPYGHGYCLAKALLRHSEYEK